MFCHKYLIIHSIGLDFSSHEIRWKNQPKLWNISFCLHTEMLLMFASHTGLAPFYLAHEQRRLRPPEIINILFMNITSCVQHLQHNVPIALSSVWGCLVQIWRLSAVRLRFPQCHRAKFLLKVTYSPCLLSRSLLWLTSVGLFCELMIILVCFMSTFSRSFLWVSFMRPFFNSVLWVLSLGLFFVNIFLDLFCECLL